MMKQLVLVGTLVGALGAGAAYAQTPATPDKPATQKASKPATSKRASAGARNENAHTAPKPQPETAPAPSVPTGDMPLGTVHLPKSVKADGKPLPPGVYQVRLTAQTAAPEAKGQTPALERWVEFVQKGQVKGREVVTIIPQPEADKVQKDAPPPANSAKVEMLKGGNYYRVWINKGGSYYLIHLPPAA
jgi:hypothetical protein